MNAGNENNYPIDAGSWDARLRTADCTAEERMAFKVWCKASPANQREYDQLRTLLSELRAAGDAPEIRALREWAVESTAPESARLQRNRAPVWVAMAATISAIAFGLWITNQTPVDDSVVAEFATAVGERSTANLDDGSVATLNTNTQLALDFSDDERRVTLIQGQALFDVAKDPNRPFVVIAGEQRIVAVGTVFDVRLEQGGVSVVLVEGVVDVFVDSNPNSGGSAISPVRMTAGQRLVTSAAATAAPPVIEETDTERATIWKDGRVFFEDSALADAVQEMNRYSTVKIIVEGESIEGLRINGMFRTGHPANFVSTLEAYFPLVSEQVGESTIVIKSR